MLHWHKLEVSGSFLLLLSFLYYMDMDGILLPAILSCTLHELGHYLAVRLCGGRVTALRLTCVGAEMHLACCGRRDRVAQCFMALSGPAVNLCLAVLAARIGRGEGAWIFAGVNLCLGLFNLLPVRVLDGGRVLRALLESSYRREQLAEAVSAGVSLGLAGAGFWLMLRTGNPTLFLTGTWLAAGSVPRPEKRRRSKKSLANGKIVW